MAEWAGRVGVALQPLVDRLTWHLLQGHCMLMKRRWRNSIRATAKQNAPTYGRTAVTISGWGRASSCSTTKPVAAASTHLISCAIGMRHLVVDDYGGYKPLFAIDDRTELGCWMHARRKFFDLHKASSSEIALEALQRIGILYAIEAEGEQLTIEARQQLRAEKSIPAQQSLHGWLLHIRQKTADGSSTAKAIDYTLKRWPSLIRYANSGSHPIDNNPIENNFRAIAIGRKNWLFIGSERAGQRAAAIQSLLTTAKLNGLAPAKWLTEPLEKLPTWPNSRIDELLPFAPEVIETLMKEC